MSAPEPQILPNGRVVRYSFHERVIHWLAGFSYIYLMLTGLAFWSPWLFWMAIALGGADSFARIASVGRADFCCIHAADVPDVGPANEEGSVGQSILGRGSALR